MIAGRASRRRARPIASSQSSTSAPSAMETPSVDSRGSVKESIRHAELRTKRTAARCAAPCVNRSASVDQATGGAREAP